MDGPPDDQSAWDKATFEQWLQQTAESRDASSQEILNQLASSLWALDELEALLEETDIHTDLPTDASTEGTNPQVEDQFGDIKEHFDALADRLDTLEERHEDLDAAVSKDVGNIEEVLRYLVEQTDTLSERVSKLDDRLDTVTKRLRQRDRMRSRLADLKADAADIGITTAKCEQCGNAVDISLLVVPECPTCNLAFDTVEPKDSWLGSPTIGSTATTPDSSIESIHRQDKTSTRQDKTSTLDSDTQSSTHGASPGDASRDVPQQAASPQDTETPNLDASLDLGDDLESNSSATTSDTETDESQDPFEWESL